MAVNGAHLRFKQGFGCSGRRAARMMHRLAAMAATCAAAWLPATAALAQADPMFPDTAVAPGPCASLGDARQRLACYDAAAAAPPAAAGAPAARTLPNLQGADWMTTDWELDGAHKRGTFRFFTYRPNFILPVHYSSDVNRNPTSPTPGRSAELPEYRNVETKLQISLRTKLAQSVLLPDADIWLGYTQVSLWQLWSSNLSAPFRSTDYEPEIIYLVPTPAALSQLPWGWRWRFAQVALAHQSNGQAEPLSRSWNRVYVGAGLERGEWAAIVRVARRLREDPQDDDNPDLTSFRGRADLSLVWDGELARLALNWRNTLRRLDRGSLELNWVHPVGGSRDDGLHWYLQVFSGYGETLLDYNFKQTSVGMGVTLFNF
jgi:phospholipase A1